MKSSCFEWVQLFRGRKFHTNEDGAQFLAVHTRCAVRGGGAALQQRARLRYFYKYSNFDIVFNVTNILHRYKEGKAYFNAGLSRKRQ